MECVENEPNNNMCACVSYCCCCHIFTQTLSLQHLILHVGKHNTQRQCRHRRRTQRLCYVSFCCVFSFTCVGYAFWRCRRSTSNCLGYDAFAVTLLCLYVFFSVLLGALYSKMIVRWCLSSKRILKRYWCIYFIEIFTDRQYFLDVRFLNFVA